MANYKTRQAVSMFKKLKIKKTDVNHHVKGFIIDDNGKKLYPPVFVSKGLKELPVAVESKLRKSLKLSKDEFHELISCHMSRDQYLARRK